MTKELKPCPFCGTPNPVIIKGGWVAEIEIRCANWDCMAMIVDEELEDAIRHWNRRART